MLCRCHTKSVDRLQLHGKSQCLQNSSPSSNCILPGPESSLEFRAEEGYKAAKFESLVASAARRDKHYMMDHKRLS